MRCMALCAAYGEDGVEIPFNKENAENILRKHSWIREAVLDESDNLLNFQ